MDRIRTQKLRFFSKNWRKEMDRRSIFKKFQKISLQNFSKSSKFFKKFNFQNFSKNQFSRFFKKFNFQDFSKNPFSTFFKKFNFQIFSKNKIFHFFQKIDFFHTFRSVLYPFFQKIKWNFSQHVSKISISYFVSIITNKLWVQYLWILNLYIYL